MMPDGLRFEIYNNKKFGLKKILFRALQYFVVLPQPMKNTKLEISRPTNGEASKIWRHIWCATQIDRERTSEEAVEFGS